MVQFPLQAMEHLLGWEEQYAVVSDLTDMVSLDDPEILITHMLELVGALTRKAYAIENAVHHGMSLRQSIAKTPDTLWYVLTSDPHELRELGKAMDTLEDEKDIHLFEY